MAHMNRRTRRDRKVEGGKRRKTHRRHAHKRRMTHKRRN